MARASWNVQKWWRPSASELSTGNWAGVPPVAISSLSYLVDVAAVGVYLVCVGVDAGNVRVEFEADVTLVVPVRFVDGDRRLRQLALWRTP